MNSFVTSLWQRRWCRFLVVGLVLCALPLLQPFVRQSVFGQTIDGIPECIWEGQMRRWAHHDLGKSWTDELLEKLGLIPSQRGLIPRGESSLPLHLRLSNDGDVKVRRLALTELASWAKKKEATVVPILRRHVEDDDPECRMLAAGGIWLALKELEMKGVALPLLAHADPQVRGRAAMMLEMMAPAAPDLFEPLSQLANDPDPGVRGAAMRSMRHFGKRGVPILHKGLTDPVKWICISAVQAAGELGQDGADLLPELRALRNDPDVGIRQSVALALTRIDRNQCPVPE